MTQEAFDLLLAQLDGDREQAAIRYEALRRKLLKFFEWRGCAFTEELADDTIDRIARSLEGGRADPELHGLLCGNRTQCVS